MKAVILLLLAFVAIAYADIWSNCGTNEKERKKKIDLKSIICINMWFKKDPLVITSRLELLPSPLIPLLLDKTSLLLPVEFLV